MPKAGDALVKHHCTLINETVTEYACTNARGGKKRVQPIRPAVVQSKRKRRSKIFLRITSLTLFDLIFTFYGVDCAFICNHVKKKSHFI